MSKGICNINGIIGQMIGDDGKVMTPYVTFLDVAAQVERQKGITHLDVFITTPGGLIEEGDDIVQYFESLKAKGITVHTHAQGAVFSFGVDIFLAGEERFIEEGARLMIHNPWVTLTEGDASTVEAYAKELRKLEDKSNAGYAEKTGVSIEVLKTLMKKDTYLTPQQAVEFGFATQISKKVQLKAVAFSRKFNLNQNEMSKETLTKDEAESMLDRMFNKMKQFFAPKQLKTVQDANGTEIVFTDLEPDDTPSVGDVATINDTAAQGEHVMPNGETYVFEDGKLTEIKAKEEDDNEQLAEALEEVAQLKKQLKQIRKENGTLKETVTSSQEMMKEFEANMKQLKKSIASGFDFDDPESPKGRERSGGAKTRRLYKKKKD